MFGTPANNNRHLPVVTLGKVAKLQGGYAFKSKEFVDHGVKLVQISNVNADYLDWGTIVQVPKSYVEKYPAFKLNAGDLVMAMTRPVIKGQNAVKIAKVSVKDVPCLLNQRVGRFQISDLINKIYLETLCKSEDFRDFVVQMSGNSLQPNISSKQVESYEILLPQIKDQEQFAAFVEQTDKSKFTEHFKSQFIEMFGDVKTNDKKWESRPLRELCEITRGGSPRPIAQYLGGTIPWIKIGDATDGDDIYITSTKEHIIEAGVKKSRYVKAGSLIFANCGVSLGFCRIINIDGCIHDGWLALQDIDKSLNKVFLLMTINQLTDYFRSIAPGATQPNLNTEIMGNYLQIIPPLEMQQEYIAFVKQSDKSKYVAFQETKFIENLLNYTYNHYFRRKNYVH